MISAVPPFLASIGENRERLKTSTDRNHMQRHQLASKLLAQNTDDIRKLLGDSADVVKRYYTKIKVDKASGK